MTIAVAQVVQNTTLQNTSTATVSQAITVGAGSIIHGIVCWQAGGPTLSSVADGTNTYTVLDNLNASTGGVIVAQFYTRASAAGTYTVTVIKSSAGIRNYIALKEITGGSVSPLDQHAAQVQATPTTTANATTSGATSTLSHQPALASGWCASTQYSGSGDAVGTGFTSDLSQALTTAGMYVTGENLRVTATTGIAATFTSTANFEHASFIAVFDEASAVGLVRKQIGITPVDMQQSSTGQPLEFFLVSSTDGVTPVTGLGSAPVVTLSKNGASFAAASGAVSEIGNGWYQVAGNATDTNTVGKLTLHATGSGAINFDAIVGLVVPWNPLDGVRQGMTALPNVASGSAGAIPTTGTGANQISVSGGVVSANTTQIGGLATRPRYTGQAQTGATNSITLAASTPAATCEGGDVIVLTGGTGAGQSNIVLSLSGGGTSTPVATVIQNWPTANPDSSTTYEILKIGGAVPSAVTDVWDNTKNPARTLTAATNITQNGAAIPTDSNGFVNADVQAVNSIVVS